MRVVYLIDSEDPLGSEWVATQHARALREVDVDAEVVVAGTRSSSAISADDFVRLVPSLGSLDEEVSANSDVAVAGGARGLRAADRLGFSTVAGLLVVHRPHDPPPDRDGEAASAGPTLWLAASPLLVELLQSDPRAVGATGSSVWIPTATAPCPPGGGTGKGLRVLLSPLPDDTTDEVSWARDALAPLLGETPPVELEDLQPEHPGGKAASRLSLADLLERTTEGGLVVGTWRETLGLDFVALQALSCGRPAVLTEGPSYRDLDPRRRASLTVPAHDPEALRSAVRRLRDDSELHDRLAARARRFAASPTLRASGELLREVLTAARGRQTLMEDWRRRSWPAPVPSTPVEGAEEAMGVDRARRYQWEVEREIAGRLLDTTRAQRRQLYSLAYDDFFRRVPQQPQLAQSRDLRAQRTLVELQLRLIEPFVTPATVFLEIGAGDCAFARALATRVSRVHAVEASRSLEPQMGGEEPSGFHFTVADLPPVPVADGSVDVAYSSHVVEHLHPDDLVPHLADVRRVLVPGGLYVCITPNRLLGPHDVSRYFAERASGLHLREYTHRELGRALLRSGFAPVRALRRLGRRPPRGWLALVRVVEGLLELVPPPTRRRLLGGIARRPEPFRPLEQVKLVAWRPRRG